MTSLRNKSSWGEEDNQAFSNINVDEQQPLLVNKDVEMQTVNGLESSGAAAEQTRGQRLASIDMLRGFIMMVSV